MSFVVPNTKCVIRFEGREYTPEEWAHFQLTQINKERRKSLIQELRVHANSYNVSGAVSKMCKDAADELERLSQ